MASNTVEAVLKSRYEDGIQEGVENAQSLMQNAFNSMKDANAAFASAFDSAFESTASAMESWRTSLSKAADESDSSFKKMSLGAVAFGIGAAEVFLHAAKAAGDFIVDLVKESSEVAEARINFEALTAAQGINADQMLGKLKQATEGQVSQLTLLRNANKVMQADLPITSEQYVKLTENVTRLAKSAGTDAVQAQDALTEALIRGQSRALGPAIGIHLAVRGAVNSMASAMNDAAGGMPDRASMQAMYNDMLVQTNAAVAKLPPQFLTLEEVLTEAHNAWSDLLDDWGTAITRSGVFQELLQRASDAMDGMNTSMDQQRQMALEVNGALISVLRTIASIVQIVGYLSYVWDALKGMLTADLGIIIGLVVDVAHAINSMVIAVVEGFSMLPGAAGRAFQPVLDWLKKSQETLETYRSAATDTIMHSFDGFGDSARKVSSFADATNKLATDMESLRGKVLDGADGIQKHGSAAQAAAQDQKALNDQLDKYREMLFSLNQAVATPDQKAMAEFAKEVEEIGKLDKISADQRNELYAAAWAKYQADQAKRDAEDNARQKAQNDQQFAAAQQQAQKILDLDTEFALRVADEAHKAGIQREQDIRKVATIVGLDTAEGKRLLLMIEQNFNAEMKKLKDEADRKTEEENQKQISKALEAANAINKAVEDVAKGSLPESSAITALKNIPQVLDTLKAKLDELHKLPTFTDAQIAEVQKLEVAINNLNKLNLKPLQQAFDQMKQHIQSTTAQGLTSFSQMLGGMLQGQSVTGTKLLAEAGKMLGGLISQMGTSLIQTGVAAVVACATGMPGPWSYTGGIEAIAEGMAMTALGSALGGGSSSGGGTSAPSAPSSSSSSTNPNPSVLQVGAAGSGNQQATQNQQTQHLVTLSVQSNDSHIVKVVQQNLQQNGPLRVAVKQNG